LQLTKCSSKFTSTENLYRKLSHVNHLSITDSKTLANNQPFPFHFINPYSFLVPVKGEQFSEKREEQKVSTRWKIQSEHFIVKMNWFNAIEQQNSSKNVGKLQFKGLSFALLPSETIVKCQNIGFFLSFRFLPRSSLYSTPSKKNNSKYSVATATNHRVFEIIKKNFFMEFARQKNKNYKANKFDILCVWLLEII
jgi:hypothetical protein